jgi:hypothetical protein
MIKSAATLKRWIAATGGDLPYPSSPDQIGMDLGLRLQQVDPELFQIVSGGGIPASLELSVMDGSLPDVAPTQQERQDAANAARIEELTASNPYGTAGYYNEQGDLVPPTQGNLTAVLELENLNPELAARLKAEAQPAQPAHQFTEGDLRVLAQHGFAVPQS